MQRDDKYRIGKYFLGKRTNSSMWCRCWFENGQTKRESLRTNDFERAKELLADWYTCNVLRHKEEPRTVPLGEVFAQYYERHARHTVSANTAKNALRMALESMPQAEPMVSDFGPMAQQQLIDTLMERYPNSGHPKRLFASIKAAILWAYRNEIITNHPPFAKTPPDGEPYDRVLSIAELARLWDTAKAPHMRAFLMTLIATACRAKAARLLSRPQCDLDNGIIDLHPPGEQRTKKRNPIVPMPTTFRPWVESAKFYIVDYQGRPLSDHRKAFKALRQAAGFDQDVTARTIRRTVATEMMRRGVPTPIISHYLGHQVAEVWTTTQYLKFQPDYLVAGSQAIDEIISEMGRVAACPTRPFETAERASNVLHPNFKTAKTLVNPGAAGEN